ncbi:MAG TPA: class I SAM-dependent methyltransferase [Bryobacteraceae bacterium]|nr:class I SAM-dependent methyltransferase [Bryobacteraceae bacterium]
MKAAFRGNAWFLDSYWPLNENRVRMIINDVAKRTPPGGRVLEVGCGNGYIAVLLAKCGYQVTATDAWEPPERAQLFETTGVECFPSNLNDIAPFPHLADTFDTVILGEVIEHILNWPLGLLNAIASHTRARGSIIVTTPNSCTLMNAMRMVTGKYSLWGASEFIGTPKIGPNGIISCGEIHYREYSPAELQQLIKDAGYDVDVVRFYPCGIETTQSPWKRAAKRLVWPLLRTRLLGAGQYVIGRKR